jgi:hypothetical protein
MLCPRRSNNPLTLPYTNPKTSLIEIPNIIVKNLVLLSKLLEVLKPVFQYFRIISKLQLKL